MTSRPLARGAEGADVRALQVALVAGRFARLSATGVFDATTEAALRTAQRALGVPVSGRVCPATTAALAAHRPPTDELALTGWGSLT